jgi:4-amino-4-deoxy-L-arabinose transferase-like glycosyltransferase
LTLAAVLPFLGKPLHIDEESYLFIGREIQPHLLRPYDWWRAWQPQFTPGSSSFIYAHPPLFLWIVAGLERLWGSETLVALRASMLPFVLLLVLSFYGLARRLVAHAGPATVTFLFSPAILLVLHQSLMIDLPFVALSLAGVWMLYDAGVAGRRRLQWLAGMLLGLAALTKYPALVLLPLAMMPIEPAGRGPLRRVSWPVAAGMAAVVVPWELWTLYAYGSMHLPFVLEQAGRIARSPLASRAVGTLAQLGWSVIAPPVAALALWPARGRQLRLALAIGSAGLLIAALLPIALSGSGPTPGLLTGWTDDLVGEVPHTPGRLLALGAALALGVLALSSFRLHRGADRFLTLWAAVTLASALFTHNFAGARYLAPAAAPLHLLLWRRLEREAHMARLNDRPPRLGPATGVATAAGAAIALWVASADARLARVYPVLGREVEAAVARAGVPPSRVWFTGEWGFRWEMERRGYRYLAPDVRLPRGDLVVQPLVACPSGIAGIDQASVIYERSFRGPWLRTMAPGEGIGYYSEIFGLLPYGPGDGPLESVKVWEMR